MGSFVSFLNLWNSTSTQNRSVLASRTSANGCAFIITSPLRQGKPYCSLGLIGLVGPAAASRSPLQLVVDQYRALGDPRVPRRNSGDSARGAAGLAPCIVSKNCRPKRRGGALFVAFKRCRQIRPHHFGATSKPRVSDLD